MPQKNRSDHRSTGSTNFATKIFGGFVGKVINIGKADTVNVLHSPWFGVVAIATITLTGFATYRIFAPQHITIDNLPKDTLVINNLPSLSSDGKQSNEEKQKAQALVQKYQQAVQQNPNDAIVRTNLGETLRRVGDLAGAQREQEKALQLKPDLQAAKIGLALIQQDQGNANGAKQTIQQTLNPDKSAAAYFYLGLALYNSRDLKGAEAVYREAIRLDFNFSAAHHNLGTILSAQGKSEEAIAQYQEAIRLNPNDSEAHHNLGKQLETQGKSEEAIAQYREAIRLGPNNSEAYYSLGHVLQVQSKLEEAVIQYREAIRIIPGFSMAHNNLGRALYVQGKTEEAIIHYQTATLLDPGNANAHVNIGIALYNQGDHEKAFAEWTTAKALFGKQGNAEGFNESSKFLRVCQEPCAIN